jgi:hypothetical protein
MLRSYSVVCGILNIINVSQPAVSKTLAEIEAGLGVKLSDRLPKGLNPTSFGQCLASYESVVEMDYGIAVTPWLQVRPNLQYVIRPGGTGQVPNAWSLVYSPTLRFDSHSVVFRQPGLQVRGPLPVQTQVCRTSSILHKRFGRLDEIVRLRDLSGLNVAL